MARRLAFPLRLLQQECVGFCADDPRVVVKDGDGWNISLRTYAERFNDGQPEVGHRDVRIRVNGTRQLRAVARQFEMLADWHEREELEPID